MTLTSEKSLVIFFTSASENILDAVNCTLLLLVPAEIQDVSDVRPRSYESSQATIQITVAGGFY